MKYIFFTLIVAFGVSCVDDHKSRNDSLLLSYSAPTPTPALVSTLVPALGETEPALACFEQNLPYLKHKPTSLKEFAARIGEAEYQCHASREQTKIYVAKIVELHGDYQ